MRSGRVAGTEIEVPGTDERVFVRGIVITGVER